MGQLYPMYMIHNRNKHDANVPMTNTPATQSLPNWKLFSLPGKQLTDIVIIYNYLFAYLFDVRFNLPLDNLWILCSDYYVAYGWKTGNMNGLLPKAKIAKIQAQSESKRMT